MKIKYYILILFIILFLPKDAKLQWYEKHPSLNALGIDTANYWNLSENETATGNNTLLGSLRFSSLGQSNDSTYRILNDTALFYTNILSIRRAKGHAQLQIKNEDPGTGLGAILTFQNTETGTVDVYNNSWIGNIGAEFYVANGAPGGMYTRVGGHDKDFDFKDTSGVTSLAIRNKGNVNNSVAKWRTPLASNSNFKFLRLYVDSTTYTAYNVENPFGGSVGLNLIGKDGATWTKMYIDGSGNSIFDGLNSVRFKINGSSDRITLTGSAITLGLATTISGDATFNSRVKGLSVVSSAGTLTLGNAVHYVFSGTTTTWTLPAVTGNTDVFYFIKNRGSGDITLNRAGSDEIYTTSAVTSTTISAGASIRLWNDGTYWIVE
jgi:hypothetical protein